ncbi:MAG: SagB family peptide dehydrogenase [Simkania sp.]|nr:SagB family peptide dehydrogenase [Simkania sp.]
MYLQFKSTVTSEKNADGVTILRTPFSQIDWKENSSILNTCLQDLWLGKEEDTLAAFALQEGGSNALAELYYYLDKLKKHHLLNFTITSHDLPLFTLNPFPPFDFETHEIQDSAVYQLSRFCYARREGSCIVLETPLCSSQLILQQKESLFIFHALAQPCSANTLSADFPQFSQSTIRQCLQFFLNSKMIDAYEGDSSQEEQNPIFIQWDFHDLLFHSRSRSGRSPSYPKTAFPFRGKIPPTPAIKTSTTSERIALFRPDMETLQKEDPPFSRVLETRTSQRVHGDEPITIRQLGEFLFRCARIKHLKTIEDLDFSARPYPSGGALYELELYPIIQSCAGISSSLYHYNAQQHELHKISNLNKITDLIVHRARLSTTTEHPPQILIIIAARFQRVSWKYPSGAYALILKNTGVLLQTMYLVATAMDLAPCAVGTGNADLFAKAIDSNYYEETSVGEFILGSKKN